MVVKLKEGKNYVIKLGEEGKLYLKDVVDALYPDISKDIIDKVHRFSTHHRIEKFGFDFNDFYNGGKYEDSITWTGNLNKTHDCINIPPSSSRVESYSIKDDKV